MPLGYGQHQRGPLEGLAVPVTILAPIVAHALRTEDNAAIGAFAQYMAFAAANLLLVLVAQQPRPGDEEAQQHRMTIVLAFFAVNLIAAIACA